jgi:hypothetical protein
MRRHRRRAGPIRRTLAAAVLTGAGAASAGCGAETEYANAPRPAAPINVTAAITDDRVRISPRTFGAGPIILIIANQSRRAQEFTLETAGGPGGGPGIRQTTSAVNPRGTAELKDDVEPGLYRLSVRDIDVRPAAIRVGGPRPSAQDELLQP